MRGCDTAKSFANFGVVAQRVAEMELSAIPMESALLIVGPPPTYPALVKPTVTPVTVGVFGTYQISLVDEKGVSVSPGIVSKWDTANHSIATINSSGLLYGNGPGLTNVLITVPSSTGQIITIELPVTVSNLQPSKVTIAPSSVKLTVGQSKTLTATVYDASGNLIPGTTVGWTFTGPVSLMKNSTGASITATAIGTATVTAYVGSASANATVIITASTPALSITTIALNPSTATVGTAYTAQAVTAIGGTGSYTWSASSTSLPNGVTMNATTGVLSGTPTVANTYNINVTVHDSSSPQLTVSKTLPLTVLPNTVNPTGTLTLSANSCTIQAGGSSCTVNATWSTTNPVGDLGDHIEHAGREHHGDDGQQRERGAGAGTLQHANLLPLQQPAATRDADGHGELRVGHDLEWEHVCRGADGHSLALGEFLHHRVRRQQLQREYDVEHDEPGGDLVDHVEHAGREHHGGDGQQREFGGGSGTLQHANLLPHQQRCDAGPEDGDGKLRIGHDVEWEHLPGTHDGHSHALGEFVHHSGRWQQLHRECDVEHDEPGGDLGDHVEHAGREHHSGDGQQREFGGGGGTLQHANLLPHQQRIDAEPEDGHGELRVGHDVEWERLSGTHDGHPLALGEFLHHRVRRQQLHRECDVEHDEPGGDLGDHVEHAVREHHSGDGQQREFGGGGGTLQHANLLPHQQRIDAGPEDGHGELRE